MEQTLFLLLQSEFCDLALSKEQVEGLKSQLGEEQLKQLYALSKNHDLAHVVSKALFAYNVISEENKIGRAFRKEEMLAYYRYENQQHELEKICTVFDDNGIDYLALKGAVIRDYYENPYLRAGCDVDILVKKQDLKKAVALLIEQLGYLADENKGYHDQTLRSPSEVTIELHFSLEEGVENLDNLLIDAWNYATLKGENNHQHQFSNEFLIAHHVCHMAYHFINGGCGIKPFIDLKILLSKVSVNQEELDVLLRKANLQAFYKGVCNLLEVWLGKNTHTQLTKEMSQFILQGGVYGSKENSIAVSHAKNKGKTGHFFSRIFLPYNKLKVEFPVLEKQKWLFPFCQIARWFRAVFTKKNKKVKQEMQISKSISKESNLATKNMLNELGL